MFQFFGKSLSLVRTLVHGLMFMILGALTSIPGPTLIDLKQTSHTDSYSISYIFTARSIGYLIGSLTGGVILDCLKNEEIALIISSLFVAFGAYLIPWAPNLPLLLTTFAITGFAMGFTNTGINTSLLRIWGKKGAPALQFLHFLYGFGGFIAPIIAAWFLSSQLPETLSDLTVTSISQNTTLEIDTTIEIFTESNQNITAASTVNPITYVYTIIGILGTLVCFCFISVFTFTSAKKNTSQKEINYEDPGLAYTIGVVILACLITGLISGVEVSFTQMLTSYVVQSDHGLDKVQGSYMTSGYWGAFTITRLLSIAVAFKISIKMFVMFDLILAVTAAVILLTAGTWSIPALWTGTIILGVGVASIFPATLSLVEKYINVNNRIASVFTLVGNCVEMTVPLIISMHLESNPNILFYFMLGSTVSGCGLFAILNTVLTRKGEKREMMETPKTEQSVCSV